MQDKFSIILLLNQNLADINFKLLQLVSVKLGQTYSLTRYRNYKIVIQKLKLTNHKSTDNCS